MQKRPIQNHPKMSNSNKSCNLAEIPTQNSVRPEFLIKTNLPNPVKKFAHIESHFKIPSTFV